MEADIDMQSEPEQLLNTIKMPRQLTQIKNVMPASQYQDSPRNSKISAIVSKANLKEGENKQARLQSAVQPPSKAAEPVPAVQK